MRRTLRALWAIAVVGCAQNAILELQIELPAAPAGAPDEDPWFGQVQVTRAEGHPFDIPVMGAERPAVELTDMRQWDCLSVISTDDTLDVHVRVRFCRSSDCLDLRDGNPPRRLYRLMHPFYIGRRTYYRIEIPSIPACTTSAECDVGVCIDGLCGCTGDGDCAPGFSCTPGAGCVEVVDACAIEGCIAGASATFCSMDTGRHFCERNPNISRDDTYMCPIED